MQNGTLNYMDWIKQHDNNALIFLHCNLMVEIVAVGEFCWWNIIFIIRQVKLYGTCQKRKSNGLQTHLYIRLETEHARNPCGYVRGWDGIVQTEEATREHEPSSKYFANPQYSRIYFSVLFKQLLSYLLGNMLLFPWYPDGEC